MTFAYSRLAPIRTQSGDLVWPYWPSQEDWDRVVREVIEQMRQTEKDSQ